MAVKNYGIHDKWTDLDKLNNVDIKSVDGVIESVKINGEEAGGGGGGSWQTVFEGSVETVDDDGDIIGIIENLTLTGDSIKATLNGTEYILPKTEHGYGAENESGLDFSTYPLFIATGEGFCNLWTPTAGTYTLKIEEPQSGGSSDFSTAEVTVNGVGGFVAEVATLTENGLSGGCFKSPLENSFTVVLYQGETIMQGNSETPDFIIPEGETNIVYDEENGWYVIKGDCTISLGNNA